MQTEIEVDDTVMKLMKDSAFTNTFEKFPKDTDRKLTFTPSASFFFFLEGASEYAAEPEASPNWKVALLISNMYENFIHCIQNPKMNYGVLMEVMLMAWSQVRLLAPTLDTSLDPISLSDFLGIENKYLMLPPDKRLSDLLVKLLETPMSVITKFQNVSISSSVRFPNMWRADIAGFDTIEWNGFDK